jgi:S1-C subfamily serine protease
VFVAAIMTIGVLAGFCIGLIVFAPSSRLLERDQAVFDENLVTSLYDRVSPSIVEIDIDNSSLEGGFLPTDSGSGFFVDSEGHIVTNSHVVDNNGEIRVKLADGRTLEATRLGNSPADDLALLQVDPSEVKGIKPLSLADSDSLQTGQLAVAIGSPFRLQNFLSVGVVSGVGEGPALTNRPVPKMIWTNAKLLPGNSGGPLLNADGEVIGVTTAIQITITGDLGVGFAVPSNTVAGLLPDLKIAQVIKRPWLGISGTTLDKDLSKLLGLDIEQGVYIRQVWANSPAEKVQLRDDPFRVPSGRGDVITAVDGRPIASLSEMVEYFNTLRPGDQVMLTILRGGKTTHQVQVTLEAWAGG